jgi:hypothetical protein
LQRDVGLRQADAACTCGDGLSLQKAGKRDVFGPETDNSYCHCTPHLQGVVSTSANKKTATSKKIKVFWFFFSKKNCLLPLIIATESLIWITLASCCSEARKQFFFEKKNQKTFDCYAVHCRPLKQIS